MPARTKGGSSTNNWTRKNSRPKYRISLFDRVRETAVSAANVTTTGGGGRNERRSSDLKKNVYQNQPYEPHQIEAVADCIEFIKKSANYEYCRPSTDSSSSSIDAGCEVVAAAAAIPVRSIQKFNCGQLKRDGIIQHFQRSTKFKTPSHSSATINPKMSSSTMSFGLRQFKIKGCVHIY